jgi:hypothetical protein
MKEYTVRWEILNKTWNEVKDLRSLCLFDENELCKFARMNIGEVYKLDNESLEVIRTN